MIDQLSGNRVSTRDRIVESARELFFEQGYGATGISQILKRSGANSGSLYHFFPTKEDLLVAVLEKYKLMLEPMVTGPARERASDPVDQVFAVLEGYRRLMEATGFALGCPIGNLGLEVSNSHPQALRLVAENFTGWSEAVAGMLEQAADRFPPEVDLRELSTYVLATMEGAVMLARTYRSMAPFDHAVSGLRDHFDRLLEAGTTWSQPRPDTIL